MKKEKKVLDLSKETNIGQLSAELSQKEALQANVTELTQDIHKEYETRLLEAVDKGRKDKPNTDFYLVILSKKEEFASRTLQYLYFTRYTCPTPSYDQVVYKYHYKEDLLKFLWALPDRETALAMYQYKEFVPPEQFDLLGYVLAWADGSLLRLVKKLNKEEDKVSGAILVKDEE